MKAFKKIWFLLLLTLLFLPMLQTIFHFVDEKPLDGAFVETPRPVVTLQKLINENKQDTVKTTQDSMMTWCTEQTGFRNSMIRLNNQLLYSAFGKISAIGPVKGNNGKTFFEDSYIISYIGETCLDKEKIDANTRQLKVIQDILRTKGITLLPVFALGKASYYPELIPEKYIARQRETNNYQEYLKAFHEQGVEMIDFNRWFCDQKGSEEHPVYCDLSAHWTVYAASLAMDSLVRYMEQKTQKVQAHAFIERFDNDGLKNQDNDLYRMMNLILPLSHNSIDNPHFGFTEGYKPKVLAIADSYWWTVWAWNVALPENLFTDGGFWFYNKTIYPERTPIQNVESINYKQEIESQEFVLLVCTEATNHLWPYGFFERYLSAYDKEFLGKQPEQYDAADSLYITFRNQEIENIIERIKASPKWLENVTRQAEEKGISLEQSLWDNADYAFRMTIEPKGFVR
ncbi:MAG: hypothetical protein II887_08200 [Bacteroidales bacterium]|nr:hypothetical protein [Bacteroidales bacterium]